MIIRCFPICASINYVLSFHRKQKEWCTDCSFFAYGGCYKDNHHIQNYNNFYQDHVFLLKSVMDDVQSSCNQALDDFKKIQFVHNSISHKLKLLKHEITSREAYSNATIAKLEDYLKSIKDVDISQQYDGVINKISRMIVEYVRVCVFTSKTIVLNHTIIYADSVISLKNPSLSN